MKPGTQTNGERMSLSQHVRLAALTIKKNIKSVAYFTLFTQDSSSPEKAVRGSSNFSIPMHYCLNVFDIVLTVNKLISGMVSGINLKIN